MVKVTADHARTLGAERWCMQSDRARPTTTPLIRRRSVTFASTDLALGQTVRKANRSLGYFLYDLEGMQS
jgi:hypothetical protein